jgi:DNA-binding MarR family transcriptional regulator
MKGAPVNKETQRTYHEFMERYMGLQRVMRANQRRHMNCNPTILVGIHSINEGKPVTISQIGSKLDVSNAAVTQMIDNLEKRGFVERFSDDNDRRITLVRLTESGIASLRVSFQETTAFLDGLFQHLGEEDTQHLNRLIDKVMEYTMANFNTPEEKK